ncbi:MAG TPA: hypothetical protein PKG96_09865 [Bacilli bacterium]|jgi:hypothetical protein|nr:MAG: hypothetical protein BWX55_01457 [Deltaproteobacteria bacterium ADurb.Bin022]HOD62389.1 hypothetical protein [Bacilli bacterium]
MQEIQMSTLKTVQLRYHEAEYFYSQFIIHSGPPYDSYFKMVCYLDAFLSSLVSIEEMVNKCDQKRLRKIDLFRFIKALRNIAVHHCVFAAPQPEAKFERPFFRHLSDSIGGEQESSSKLAIKYDVLREIFKSIEAERKNEKETLEAAQRYLSKLESRPQPVYIDLVLHDALNEVKAFVQ